MRKGATSRIVRWALPVAMLAALLPAGLAVAGKHKVRFGARALGPGSHGKDVRFLQRALTTLGYPTTVDGAYGKGTYKNVKRFERQRHWRVNGRVSKKDAKKIGAIYGKRRAVKLSGLYFAYGLHIPTLTLSAQKAGSARVDVQSLSSGTVQSIAVSFTAPGTLDVPWNGITAAGTWAPEDTYRIKLADPGSAHASVTGGQTGDFLFRLHAFPVLGDHDFGGAGSRFGAPRSGHTHQGQDVAAACGTRLIVAEGGPLRVNSYQASGAGYYVVIHGAVTGTDFVYMHMKKASWAPEGSTVYAGQQIGKVGATGDAQGCHLHFENWSAPGWYVGGAPFDPLPELLAWDTYS
jgi:murein DD-endopeptidase MepM/ murein hydrolase activator NlpD